MSQPTLILVGLALVVGAATLPSVGDAFRGALVGDVVAVASTSATKGPGADGGEVSVTGQAATSLAVGLAGTATAEDAAHLEQQLNHPKFRTDYLRSRGVEVVAVRDSVAEYGTHNRSKNHRGEHVLASFDRRHNRIVVPVRNEDGVRYVKGGDHVLLHEIGHAVDQNRFRSNDWAYYVSAPVRLIVGLIRPVVWPFASARDEEFMDALRREPRRAHDSHLSKAVGSGEPYAQSYALYHGEPVRMAYQYPELFDYWSRSAHGGNHEPEERGTTRVYRRSGYEVSVRRRPDGSPQGVSHRLFGPDGQPVEWGSDHDGDGRLDVLRRRNSDGSTNEMLYGADGSVVASY